jgi:hypothetical protein
MILSKTNKAHIAADNDCDDCDDDDDDDVIVKIFFIFKQIMYTVYTRTSNYYFLLI